MHVNRNALISSRAHLIGLCVAALSLACGGCMAQSGDEEETGAEEMGAEEGGAEAVGTGAQALTAGGVTYRVGPSRQYKTLGAVADLLEPGDVVEVDGGATYPGDVTIESAGTASRKITIRGVRVNGRRPRLSGGTNTIELAGNHVVLEGFEVTGGDARCIFHHAHDVTIRDTVVHDCPSHGVLGADDDSGSLLMEYVEVYACGSGTSRHPVYISTDQAAYPGSVFRMQHSYIHDASGGNAVKSRAERNEIYYNWIEGGLYKELELIGPDADEDRAREDSDVVGNVFRKTHTQHVVRIGGDGTGQTWGRYRFVNNTFLLTQDSAAAIHVYDGIESLELHNNIFHRVGGGSVDVLRDDGAWASGRPVISGTRNCAPDGSSLPGGLTQTVWEDDPGFANLGARDLHLRANSPLRRAGAAATASPGGHAFPSPLARPRYEPPPRRLQAVGAAVARPASGALDLGAFE